MRDAVLLPPPAALSIPIHVDRDGGPVLRFSYGMLRDAHEAPGDGAELTVAFTEDGREDPFLLTTIPIDPKNDESHRSWSEARIDLKPIAGKPGRLHFRSRDVEGEGEDLLDAVVIATPRIEPTEGVPAAPNLLLIGVDTLRADRLSAYGYDRDTTPNLKRLAANGVLFSQARSQAPWTLPSFASILTSLYPSAHGAGRGGHDEWTPIDKGSTSLAEVLATMGWQTQGIVANGLISPQYGIDQGFESYRFAWAMESVGRDAPHVGEFIEDHTTTPWFLFWHIMDPHLPYSTDEEHKEAFTDEDYMGKFAWGGGEVPFHTLDPRPGRRWHTHEGPPPMPDLADEDFRYISDYYDAEIAETDAAIGEVLATLDRSGQADRTIVALVADHGEGLGDHDHYHHGYTLFDDQVHVPLLIHVPGEAARTIERPVAAIDLAPTLLGLLHVDAPEAFQGVDRLASDAPTDDPYIIEYPTYDSSAQKGWVEGRFKYLHDPVFHTEALYDVLADPGEKSNILDQHPDVVARARADLDRFRWEQLQKGRYHLRIQGRPGARLALRITTDDLFDANFASRPQRPETDFEMDLARQNLVVDTELPSGRIELVFWCRGTAMTFDVTLDGEPIDALHLGAGDPAEGSSPFAVTMGDVPRHPTSAIPVPKPGTAVLWLEEGLADVQPVVPTPEEIERLQELGYAR